MFAQVKHKAIMLKASYIHQRYWNQSYGKVWKCQNIISNRKGQTERDLGLFLPQQGCLMGTTHERCAHCSATHRGCFRGMVVLVTPCPVVVLPGQPIKQLSRQSSAPWSCFLVEAHISFVSLLLGQPQHRETPWQCQLRLLVPRCPLRVPGEAAGPQGSPHSATWGCGSPNLHGYICRRCCKTLRCYQHSLDKL